jgi:hypothetical protein
LATLAAMRRASSRVRPSVCGDGDQIDVEPDDLLLAGVDQKEVGRLRLAAPRLVTASRCEIATVAAALLRHGTLSGDQIIALANDRLGLQSR